MLSNNITTRKAKRQPLCDRTNNKVKEGAKQTSRPYIKRRAINICETKNKHMTKQHKPLDQKLLNTSVTLSPCKNLQNYLKSSDNECGDKMHLRERKIKNYQDLLRNSPDVDVQNSHKKHIPVYCQKLKSKPHTKNKDPFEFSDEKPVNRKMDDYTDSDSSTFDKSMKEILNEIKIKEKKTLRKKIIKKNFTQNDKKRLLKVNNTENVNKNDPIRRIILPTPSNTNDNNTTSSSSPKQINIISNVIVRPPVSIPSPVPSSDGSYYVDQNDVDCQPTSTPWRGDDLNLKRNPHWLALKNTSLPFYNQEMILQPELLEKTLNKSVTKENSYVQTHISDYIDQGKEVSVQVNTSSLFDEHGFSPIKNVEKRKTKTPVKMNDSSSLFENTFSPIKNRSDSNVMKAKRSILSSVNRDLTVDNVQDVQSSFSLSFLDDEDKENMPRGYKNKKGSPNALPMRVSLSDLKKVQKEAVEELLEDLAVNQSLNESLPVVETSEPTVTVGLFEDLQPPPVADRTYASKKRRKVRIASVEEEEEENLDSKPKKKKNRTKAEEKEFKKWAASFNAMCQEVEQHHLEIE